MKTICLDFDDFSVLNNRLDLLLRLKDSYPQLKVTMFTIPYDYAFEKEVSARIMRKQTLKAVRKCLDWIEIVPHGLTHMPDEFAYCDYKTMKSYVLPAIREAFRKDKLPYAKGFKAPYWKWSEDVIKVLNEEDWWGAVDKMQTDMKRTRKYYVYTHGINERFALSTLDTIKLHGHITAEAPNNIERCFTNLFKMPTDAKFKFASELIEEDEDNSVGK